MPTQGARLIVSFVRTQPGMFEEYHALSRKHIQAPHGRIQEAGIITDYSSIRRGRAIRRTRSDLTVTYRHGSVDDLQARLDPTAKQAFGSLAKAASASADRGKLRMEVGSQWFVN